jgi:hypothetical protein
VSIACVLCGAAAALRLTAAATCKQLIISTSTSTGLMIQQLTLREYFPLNL